IGGVALCYWLDPQPDWRHPHFGERGLVGLSIATLIGGFLQLIVQFPSLGRVGFRFRLDFNWRDPGVRTILGMMGPATIAASAVQVNVADSLLTRLRKPRLLCAFTPSASPDILRTKCSRPRFTLSTDAMCRCS